jgi:hypothetical protein
MLLPPPFVSTVAVQSFTDALTSSLPPPSQTELGMTAESMLQWTSAHALNSPLPPTSQPELGMTADSMLQWISAGNLRHLSVSSEADKTRNSCRQTIQPAQLSTSM